ncbi:hypothetical protein [Chondromyces apiculatus]|uniref:Uncharacterized protein n=1 Tax=Chondromyces apiculatus DSM 436 TaxID=1192034 RepID=A0A017T826_9BACT|nr:hypothetical protein [Chondromyces apiculatus]EYF05418.1 Hypothetical protein CAP_3335 [Chondromyces apiculatus DSM 436]
MPRERLGAARGAVCDGVAAVESFVQLLGSRRVGPRGILRALPEVREGCATLRVDLKELDAALQDELAGDAEGIAAAQAVIQHAVAEVTRLEAELAQGADEGGKSGKGKGAAERGIDARQRLTLESQVRRASRALESTFPLLDLVVASLDLRPTPLNLTDLLRERGSGLSEGEPAVKVTIACGQDCDNIDADPRLVGGLLEIAMGILGAAGVTSPQIQVHRRPDGRAVMTVLAAHSLKATRPSGSPVELKVPLRESGMLARSVACATAKRARIELTLPEPEAPVVTLVA